MYKWILASVVIILALSQLFWVFYKAWKERDKLKSAWAAMSSWEKISLQIGLLLYACLPMFKAHPSSSNYAVSVLLSLMEAIANGAFLVGVLAFLQRGHEQNNRRPPNA